MDMLGHDLQTVLENSPTKTLPLKYVIIIGLRILSRLEDIHAAGFLHRDVKPQNFLLAKKGGSHTDVWAVDFGLAKAFRGIEGAHLPYCDNKRGLTGTPRFASTFTQRGEESSRRDDLESMMFVLAYLYRGMLPWQKVPRGIDREARNNEILKRKQDCSFSTLYHGMGLEGAATYIRGLKFDEDPANARNRATMSAA